MLFKYLGAVTSEYVVQNRYKLRRKKTMLSITFMFFLFFNTIGICAVSGIGLGQEEDLSYQNYFPDDRKLSRAMDAFENITLVL
mmetsp:Transcript_17452/g.19781  ORF Transcript_17452/g.19781 Transcript_17452/m.19781 type:complete len:84 (+) Transcript_17452:83-334(+)